MTKNINQFMTKKIEHKEIQVFRKIGKWRGYSPECNYFEVFTKDQDDIFLSNVEARGKIVTTLFSGLPSEIPIPLLDKMFQTYENGDGFWYRAHGSPSEICVGEDRESGRKNALKSYLEAIGNPAIIFIYEIRIN